MKIKCIHCEPPTQIEDVSHGLCPYHAAETRIQIIALFESTFHSELLYSRAKIKVLEDADRYAELAEWLDILEYHTAQLIARQPERKADILIQARRQLIAKFDNRQLMTQTQTKLAL